MTAKQFVLCMLFCCGGLAVSAEAPKLSKTYGDVSVSKVHSLDEHVQIYCDIPELPPIIGSNIPVCIKGLAPAATPQDNLKLLMFLNDLLLSKDSSPDSIRLKGICRGKHFCLVADVEIDGRDLCDILVEKNLARKVIQVPGREPQTNPAGSHAGSQSSRNPAENASFVASKSSKVFHRSSCPHAKRMEMSKAARFSTRQDAENTGRRPCKTCKP